MENTGSKGTQFQCRLPSLILPFWRGAQSGKQKQKHPLLEQPQNWETAIGPVSICATGVATGFPYLGMRSGPFGH